MSKPLNADEQQYRFAHNPLANQLFHTFRAMVTEKGVDAALADIAEVQAADRKQHELQVLKYIQRELINSPKEDWLGTLGEAIDILGKEQL